MVSTLVYFRILLFKAALGGSPFLDKENRAD